MTLKNKKICVVSGIFHPESGGPATYLFNLCNNLYEEKNKISVITYGDQKKKIILDKRYPYPVYRITRKAPILIRLLLFTYQLIRIGSKYDLWYINDYGLPALFANFFTKKPYILKIVADFAWEFSERHNLTKHDLYQFQKNCGGLRVRLIKLLQKKYAQKAAKIITPSKFVKSLVVGWGISANKIQVVYNAINKGVFISPLTKADARKKLQIQSDQIAIITIGRILKLKNIQLLINILPDLLKKLPNIHIYVGGDGPFLPELKKQAAENKTENNISFF